MNKKLVEQTKTLEEKNQEINLLKQKLSQNDEIRNKREFITLKRDKNINLTIKAKSKLNFNDISIPNKHNKSNSDLNVTTNTVINNKSNMDLSAIIEKSDHNKIISSKLKNNKI